MNKVPTIGINNPNRPININVPNTGVGSGNQFTNWTPPTGNFGSNTGNTNINIPTFNPPSMNIPTGNKSYSNNVKLPETNIQQIFENDLDNTGVMNYTGGATPENIIQLANLINVRSTMPSDWGGPNVLKNLKVLNLSGSSLSGPELSPLFKSIYYQNMDLNLLDLSYNKMCDNSLGEMLWSIGNESGKQIHAIRNLKINNNQLSDKSAEYLNWHLSSGSLKDTKYIDISGNNITKVGVDCFATALTRKESEAELNLRYLDVSNEMLARELRSHAGMEKMLEGIKKAKAHITVVIAKITNGISTTGALVVGSKEEKQAIIKDTLQTAQNNGVDVKNVAVSKSIMEGMLNFNKVYSNLVIGFTKCNIIPESLGTFAADQILAKVSKKAHVVNAATDVTLCFFGAFEDVAISSEGVQFIKDVDLFGANVLIDNIE